MAFLAKIPETSLWANRKCLLICAIVAIANMQYGLDSAAIGSLQAMPGFLMVFGYKDPSQAGGYAIEVIYSVLKSTSNIINQESIYRVHSKD